MALDSVALLSAHTLNAWFCRHYFDWSRSVGIPLHGLRDVLGDSLGAHPGVWFVCRRTGGSFQTRDDTSASRRFNEIDFNRLRSGRRVVVVLVRGGGTGALDLS